MVKLTALALVPGLLLFGCAAKSESQKLTDQRSIANSSEQVCQTATAEALREELPKTGAKLRADLEGEPFDGLVKFLSPYLRTPIPAGSDRALIFVNERGIALIVWLKQGCAAGHSIGPWDPVQKHLGVAI